MPCSMGDDERSCSLQFSPIGRGSSLISTQKLRIFPTVVSVMYHAPTAVSTGFLQLHTHSTTSTKMNTGLGQYREVTIFYVQKNPPTSTDVHVTTCQIILKAPLHTLPNKGIWGYSYMKVRGRSAKPQALVCEVPNQMTVETIHISHYQQTIVFH
jgi:hypothetical protein